MKKLTVTIATYNRAYLLEKVLLALANQSLSPKFYEIIICDSQSTDTTSQVINRFTETNPDIKIQHLHTENILASKRNLGIKHAQNEVVIFFDDDCIPDNKCLEIYFNLFQESLSDNDKVIFCGEVRFPKEWVEKSNYYRFRDSRHFGSGNRPEITTLDFKTIVVMNMAFLKAPFLESIQEVNEAFVGYGCEDQDLGWRLHQQGYKLVMCDALITHYEMSRDISGYTKKIFHTARDGMTTLLKVNPDAACSLGLKFRLIEPLHPKKNSLERKLTEITIRIIFNNRVADIVTLVLKNYDNNRLFYRMSLYKYVISCAYVKGALSRKYKTKLSDGWYD